MTRRAPLYLALYDVTKNRERDKVAGVLEGFGFRIQKSAFEARLTRAQRTRLLSRLSALDLQSGFVLLYRVDERHRRDELGKLPEAGFSESDHAFVG